MLSPADIHAQALRQYPAVLRAIALGESTFPKDIRFGRPNPAADWSVLQTETTALAQAKLGYEIDWEEINTRRWGRQRLPVRVWFQHEADYLRMIGKTSEVQRLRENLSITRDRCPELTGWLASHVMRVVEYAPDWPDVLQVCRYFIDHPRPLRFARELPIHVGTKFVDERRPLFRSLFDFLLPAETIDTASEHFETRYGLLFDEPLIRLRILCPRFSSKFQPSIDDLSIPLSQCRALPWQGHTVLIVENKMTFLTLPPLTDTIAIFGGGNAAALLNALPWLSQSRLFYWGDLDVHGFHILARLRTAFPQVQSVLMDDRPLELFTNHRINAKPSAYQNTDRLTPSEAAVYELLQRGEILLEQEKIPHVFAIKTLHDRIDPPQPSN